jgi:glycine hydroxymethyltransferase
VEPDGRIDYEKLGELVKETKPKIIFAGTTAYPYILDFKKFGEIADSVGAWLIADISHIVGLVIGGAHPSPVPYVHIVTSTTHKSLRGPRGAIIGVTKKGISFAKSFGILDLEKRIDRAVFPGMQGGPHENTIGALAVAFNEAETEEFNDYVHQVVKNAKVLADSLKEKGYKVFGTENHLMLIDVGKERGKEMAVALEKANIFVNSNMVPHDEGSPMRPSGIRIGTPAMTTRGFREKDFIKVADLIDRVYCEVNKNEANLDQNLAKIGEEVKSWMKEFN